VPYIISPRTTKLLTDTPTLRWNDSGAASYTVMVRGGDLSWRQEDVTQTELDCPGEPTFKPGVSYLLVVEDSNGKSSQDEGLKGLGFSLLEETEAGRVRADAERIAGLGLSDEAEAFALAQLYAGRGLIAEAIENLEGLVEGGSQQAAVHQALADLYAQIGLVLLAEPRYLEAVGLAEAEGNVEGLAAIQASLGEVYYPALNNKDEAIRCLTQAKAGYETLGDTQRASELEERLAELDK
jgi:tetratricopeptide (TPR) repeat protein